jgi:protease-4
MSDAAASGGYWIAAAGSKIVAQPTTITGSIGAFGGKFVLSGLFEKLGIRFGEMSTSENAGMWSMAHSFTPTQWLKLNAQMDHIYKAFTTRVAAARGLTPEQVEKVARGRVWTGEQALALGLVDQLGGLHLALDLARQEAGLPKNAGIHIFPEPKTFLEGLRTLFSPDEEEDAFVETGILGPLLNPFKKMMTVLTMILSSQEMLYTPVGEIK